MKGHYEVTLTFSAHGYQEDGSEATEAPLDSQVAEYVISALETLEAQGLMPELSLLDPKIVEIQRVEAPEPTGMRSEEEALGIVNLAMLMRQGGYNGVWPETFDKLVQDAQQYLRAHGYTSSDEQRQNDDRLEAMSVLQKGIDVFNQNRETPAKKPEEKEEGNGNG